VASGEKLPLAQDQLVLTGHALEVRLYAEDPDREFLPQTGRISHLRFPAENAHVRVDTGITEGKAISTYYDPMIAKLIVWDRDRDAALAQLRRALAQTEIAGLVTNTAFLMRLAANKAFANAELDTGFIERFRADLLPPVEPAPIQVLALAALAVTLERRATVTQAATKSGDPWSPWAAVDGWRLNDLAWDDLLMRERDSEILCRIEYLPGGALRVQVREAETVVQGVIDSEGGLDAVIDGRRQRAGIVRRDDDLVVLLPGETHRLTIVDPRAAGDLDEGGSGQLNAPMPGKIVQVLVEEGASVEKGQPLMILEAMKMEHTISAPGKGKVAKVSFKAGEQVPEGASLLQIEAEE
jgi:3-methylcrotonyl-CoA carboxylase alpha subunit